MKSLVIAHRGASASTPENTLAAFDLAFEMGADGIELEVEMTQDQIPMVLHQSDPQQPTHGIRSLAKMTHRQVKEIDVGARFDGKYRGETFLIPTLAEVLDAVGTRGRIIIEIKRFANENQNDGREQIIGRTGLGVVRGSRIEQGAVFEAFLWGVIQGGLVLTARGAAIQDGCEKDGNYREFQYTVTKGHYTLQRWLRRSPLLTIRPPHAIAR